MKFPLFREILIWPLEIVDGSPRYAEPVVDPIFWTKKDPFLR
jgi:hypothetical protein